MDNKKLIENLELMKADIYYLSNKISRIDSNSNIERIEEKSKDLEIEAFKNKQDEITHLTKKNERRIIDLELNQENVSEQIEDIDFKFTRLHKAIINHSKKKEDTGDKNLNLDINNRIKEIENHFNEEIRKVYDNVFNEILNLKGEVENIKNKYFINKK
mgnify:CR=1 FL=1